MRDKNLKVIAALVVHFAVCAGMSYKGIAISEKHSDMVISTESRRGIPFNFLMRDILQFDNTIYDAMKYTT